MATRVQMIISLEDPGKGKSANKGEAIRTVRDGHTLAESHTQREADRLKDTHTGKHTSTPGAVSAADTR